WGIDFYRILEQDGRGPGRARRNSFVHLDHYDHSIHARRMGGVRWRLSRHDRNRRLSDERLRASCGSFYLLKQDLLRLSIGHSLSNAQAGLDEFSVPLKTLKRTA